MDTTNTYMDVLMKLQKLMPGVVSLVRDAFEESTTPEMRLFWSIATGAVIDIDKQINAQLKGETAKAYTLVPTEN